VRLAQTAMGMAMLTADIAMEMDTSEGLKPMVPPREKNAQCTAITAIRNAITVAEKAIRPALNVTAISN